MLLLKKGYGLLPLIASLFLYCGGSKKLAQEPQLIGIVPFVAENMSGDPALLNRQLIHALDRSGSFRLVFIQEKPELKDLIEMQTLADTSLRWILSGDFTKSISLEKKGKHIPGLLYQPKVQYLVSAEVRLYDGSEKRWKILQEFEASAAEKGDLQALEFDANDPSLALSAKQRELLRERAYQNLFEKIIKEMEKKMEIKK